MIRENLQYAIDFAKKAIYPKHINIIEAKYTKVEEIILPLRPIQ